MMAGQTLTSSADCSCDESMTLYCTITSIDTTSKTFTEFVITVQRGFGATAESWTVRHRFSDFARLDKELAGTGSAPSLPPKQFIGNKHAEFLAARRRCLQHYLSAVLADSFLGKTAPVQRFLQPGAFDACSTEARQMVVVGVRNLQQWTVVKHWQHAGWRSSKQLALLSHVADKRRKAVLSWTSRGADFCLNGAELERVSACLCDLRCGRLVEPIHLRLVHNGCVCVLPFLADGTLRDHICKASPSGTFLKKYCTSSTVYQLHVDAIRLIGRHVLEGLLYLQTAGIPYGQLHCGNIVLASSGFQLSDVALGVLGVPSLYRNSLVQLRAVKTLEDVDVYCFGQSVYEMAAGEPLQGAVWSAADAAAAEIDRRVGALLLRILSAEATSTRLPSLADLLSDESTTTAMHDRDRSGCSFFAITDDSPSLTPPLHLSSKLAETFSRCRSAVEERLKHDQLEYRKAVKTQKIAALCNSDAHKVARRKLMKRMGNANFGLEGAAATSGGFGEPGEDVATANMATPPRA